MSLKTLILSLSIFFFSATFGSFSLNKKQEDEPNELICEDREPPLTSPKGNQEQGKKEGTPPEKQLEQEGRFSSEAVIQQSSHAPTEKVKNITDIISNETLCWPLDSRYPITSTFHSKHRPNHDGIDFGRDGSYAIEGADVYAVFSGQVIFAKNSQDSYGKMIVLKHEQEDKMFLSVYAHLKNFHVKAGELVTRGQKIGNVGGTGHVKDDHPPHLHFEIRKIMREYGLSSFKKGIIIGKLVREGILVGEYNDIDQNNFFLEDIEPIAIKNRDLSKEERNLFFQFLEHVTIPVDPLNLEYSYVYRETLNNGPFVAPSSQLAQGREDNPPARATSSRSPAN